jgi:hypothetical protein
MTKMRMMMYACLLMDIRKITQVDQLRKIQFKETLYSNNSQMMA